MAIITLSIQRTLDTVADAAADLPISPTEYARSTIEAVRRAPADMVEFVARAMRELPTPPWMREVERRSCRQKAARLARRATRRAGKGSR